MHVSELPGPLVYCMLISSNSMELLPISTTRKAQDNSRCHGNEMHPESGFQMYHMWPPGAGGRAGAGPVPEYLVSRGLSQQPYGHACMTSEAVTHGKSRDLQVNSTVRQLRQYWPCML